MIDDCEHGHECGGECQRWTNELTRLRERLTVVEGADAANLAERERLANANNHLSNRLETVSAVLAEARARCVALERSKERWKGVARVRRLNLLDAETYRAIAADDRDAARQDLETAVGLLREAVNVDGPAPVILARLEVRIRAFLAAHPVKPSGT